LTTLFRNLFQHSFPNPLESLACTEPHRFAAQLASLAQIIRSAKSFYRTVLPDRSALILNGFEPTSWFYRAIDRYFDDFPHVSSLNIPWAPLLEHRFWSTVFLGSTFSRALILFRPDFTLRPAQFAKLTCSILFPSSCRFHLHAYGPSGWGHQRCGSSADRANERSIELPCRLLCRTAAFDPNPQEWILGSRSTLAALRGYDSP
jgi:hypothetical protein